MMSIFKSSTHSFIAQLFSLAKKTRKTILLPEGEEPRIIQAACYCAEQGIADCLLLGNEQKIKNWVKSHAIKIPPGLKIQNHIDLAGDELFIQTLVQLRQHKGMTRATAQDELFNPIVVALMKLYHQQVDGVVAGINTSTQQVLRPTLQIIKTQDQQRLSSLFFMCLPNKTLIYADCAINIQPSVAELASIAIQTAASAIKFNITPKIAFLSYSTHESGQGEAVEKIKAACHLVKEQSPYLLVDGPLQYDAAIDPTVAAIKTKNSLVAGDANIFIFPDLNSGNITYKAVQRSTGCFCLGPMLQGLNYPVNDLSRGASVEDIVATIALTSRQSNLIKEQARCVQDDKAIVV